MNKKWLLLIVGFGLVVRLYGITSPLADLSAWRQVDTDSIARNFVQLQFHIMYPQLNYDGPPPNYAELEFQLVPYLIAWLYRLFGIHVVWARIVPVLFGVGGIYFMYLLGKEQYDELTGLLSAFMFAILPLNIYFSRAVMPESAMIFFSLGALYFFLSWIKKESIIHYWLAVFFYALALLVKLPTLILFMPLFFLGYRRFGWSMFKRWETYAFLILTCLPTGLYYYFIHQIATHNFVTGIAKFQVFPGIHSALFKQENLYYIYRRITGVTLTGMGSIVFVLGVVNPSKEVDETLSYTWAGAVFIYIALVVTQIHLEYYLLPLVPVAALFMGKWLAKLVRYSRYWLLAPILIVIIANQSYREIKYYYQLDEEILGRGAEVNRLTSPDSLIIIDELSPVLLHASDRKGWRVDPGRVCPQRVEALRQEGAAFYVPARAEKRSEVEQYLRDHYPSLIPDDGLPIYDLRTGYE